MNGFDDWWAGAPYAFSSFQERDIAERYARMAWEAGYEKAQDDAAELAAGKSM